jgi:hypothetical protein
MRIHGTTGPAAVAQQPALRRSTSTGFAVAEQAAAGVPSPSTALRTVAGIDALIALQGIEDPTARRKHAVKRGRLALDALDELKIALLGGELEPAMLAKLKTAAAYLRDGSGDEALDGVLGEIELRAEVEIAKLAAR